MILGCDAAGIDEDGHEVVVHARDRRPDAWQRRRDARPEAVAAVRALPGHVRRHAWSCPARNLVPKPAALSFEEAACLPTAWLTAYRMLFTQSGLRPGDTVLVQGAGGGVATALIVLGRAAGYRVWVTSRDAGEAGPGRRARRRRGVRVRAPGCPSASTP